MKATATFETMPKERWREERGRQIARGGNIKRCGRRWLVASQSRTDVPGYLVDPVDKTCTCPDYEMHRAPCKHYEAVLYFIAWERDVAADGTVTETVTVKRRTYPQKEWSAYNASQVYEKEYVERLLKALCDGIEQPTRKRGPGRPALSVRDAMFGAVMKVYSTVSGRRAQTDLRESAAKGRIDDAMHFNTLFSFLRQESTTPLLVSLIEECARPLAAIENGQYAIDSTGFSTVTYDRWFEQKHGKLKAQHPWVKLHVMIGTVTHAVTAVKVSPEGDCPVLPELVATTVKNHDVREVAADKAYSSMKNHEVLHAIGVEAFIPFKNNAVINMKSEVWSKHLVAFLYKQDAWLPKYHRRSNVESTMWMIKSKFGASVAAKHAVGQVNETLAKCLCHNLACLVKAIFTSGLAPEFWPDAPKTTPGAALTLVSR